ncbi:TetR/AcrR family transcriptional regulator [uncultured Croceitalea sp.]|uniref:TetR/AcrR family transcriptional regulator n=1 Tax=uncultured Croceitalea sp. TaxID=1798908 RepID=UPI00330643A4
MKKETRKEEIIKVAAALFKEKGYSAVTMRDIATDMDMKAASLYNHISSKQDILKDIIIKLAEAFTNGLTKIKNSQATSLEKMEAIVALHIKITSSNTDGMASLNNDWMHLEEKLEYYLKLRLDYEDDIRFIIKDGVFKKEITAVSVDVILFSVLSTLRSLYLWIPKKEDLNPEKLAKELSKVLINGIAI